MNMRQIGIATIAIAAFIASDAVYDAYRKSQQQAHFRKQLAAFVSDANRKTPLMIDDVTRLDSVQAAGNSTVALHYTIIGFDAAKNPAEQLSNAMKPDVLQQVCSATATRQFLQAGGEFDYRYHDERGHWIMDFALSNTDCISEFSLATTPRR